MNSDNVLENGIVKRINGTDIHIERTNIGACKSCSIGSFCGMKDKSEIVVQSSDKFEIGEQVELAILPSVRVWSALLVFILPIVFLVVFYIVGFYVFNMVEGLAIILGLIGSVIAFLIIKQINNRYGMKFEIKIGKII